MRLSPRARADDGFSQARVDARMLVPRTASGLVSGLIITYTCLELLIQTPLRSRCNRRGYFSATVHFPRTNLRLQL